ncbi:MAG: hypothetical protein C0489_02775 [Candidatus Accumulibacter sp.]|nr:hypothetical protein [Accumulibacter sp.]MBA4092990.1 hypothetical protein [Accumulibacter sp.]
MVDVAPPALVLLSAPAPPVMLFWLDAARPPSEASEAFDEPPLALSSAAEEPPLALSSAVDEPPLAADVVSAEPVLVESIAIAEPPLATLVESEPVAFCAVMFVASPP